MDTIHELPKLPWIAIDYLLITKMTEYYGNFGKLLVDLKPFLCYFILKAFHKTPLICCVCVCVCVCVCLCVCGCVYVGMS